MFTFITVAFMDIDLQGHASPRSGDELVFVLDEIAGNERKEIARFGKRILPFGEMKTVVQLSGSHQIAVGQQYRALVFRCFNTCRVAGQDVGTIEKVGYPAKPFRFTLGAIDGRRTVQAAQRGVVFGIDSGGNVQVK